MDNRNNQVPADEQQIEQQINVKGLNALQLTPDFIDAQIISEQYYTFPGTTTTVCLLTLQNGFSVTGKSDATSPENFDKQIERYTARRNARDKIWSLEGYLLQYRLTLAETFTDRVAQVCHEVNRAYCQALGDTSQMQWSDAPDWQRESARMGVDLHLMGNFGPEASHISWMQQKLDEGWKYGPVKDAEKKEHPCIVPFNELPVNQQAKDYLFRQVVHSIRRLFQ